MNSEDKSFLVIGNSRWHWAFKRKNCLEFIDTSLGSESIQYLEKISLSSWAAVGNIPSHINLESTLKLNLKDVPLLNSPPWLGIDRALAAWGAFNKAKELSIMPTKGLLIADAGTVLSLTLISANGKFLGGQLMPGFNLQMSSMATRTENLQFPILKSLPKDPFPISTSEAMYQGSLNALLGSLKEAQIQAEVPIWLCGGDSPLLMEILMKRKHRVDVMHHPNLVLEGMLKLKG